MRKPRWQLAKILDAPGMPKLVGSYIWTDSQTIEQCGDYGCKLQAIGINIWERDFRMRNTFGPQSVPIQQVIHTSSIELLPVFRDEVEPTTYEALVGKENT